MSPEYAVHGHFSAKSDVFAFGVVVLEIITGKRSSRFYTEDNHDDLPHFVSFSFYTLLSCPIIYINLFPTIVVQTNCKYILIIIFKVLTYGYVP